MNAIFFCAAGLVVACVAAIWFVAADRFWRETDDIKTELATIRFSVATTDSVVSFADTPFDSPSSAMSRYMIFVRTSEGELFDGTFDIAWDGRNVPSEFKTGDRVHVRLRRKEHAYLGLERWKLDGFPVAIPAEV